MFHNLVGRSTRSRLNLAILSLGRLVLILWSGSHLVVLIITRATLVNLPSPTVEWSITLNVSWGAHWVWQFGSLLLERKLEGSQLRLDELLLDFLFKIDQFCLNLRINVSWPLQFTTRQSNYVAPRRLFLLNAMNLARISISCFLRTPFNLHRLLIRWVFLKRSRDLLSVSTCLHFLVSLSLCSLIIYLSVRLFWWDLARLSLLDVLAAALFHDGVV